MATIEITRGDPEGRFLKGWVAAAALLVGCAPEPLSPAGTRVALLGRAPATGCALVATLRGSAGYNGRSGETNGAGVEVYLRNRAAERGGDTLVITSRQLGAGGDGETLSLPRGASVSGGCPNCVTMTADAYRCAAEIAPRPTASATPAPGSPPAGEPAFADKAGEAALAAAAESARSCHRAGGPTGEARVKVTFATTGDVVYAEVEGEPFAGSVTAECVARKFRNAHVPPYTGAPRSFTATVRIDE
jgi:hypothetical protein